MRFNEGKPCCIVYIEPNPTLDTDGFTPTHTVFKATPFAVANLKNADDIKDRTLATVWQAGSIAKTVLSNHRGGECVIAAPDETSILA